jgi:protein TonB
MSATTRSPFGALIEEIRDARRAQGAPSGKAPRRGAPATGREPDLRIETRVASDPPPTGSLPAGWLWPASFLIHAAGLSAAILTPVLRSDRLPAQAAATKAFFVAPAQLTPPPPPPAPAAPRATARRPHARSASLEVLAPVAPAAIPEAITPDSVRAAITPEEAGVAEEGAAGGVAGGVPGGVVGGVIGGIPAAPAPIDPIRVGGGIKEPAKLKHVSPVYPDIAVRANVHGNVVLECTVSPLGRVTSVTIVKGIPLLDKAAIEAVKQWVYTPTLKDGIPVPVILTVTVQFGLKSAGPATGPVLPAA